MNTVSSLTILIELIDSESSLSLGAILIAPDGLASMNFSELLFFKMILYWQL